MSGLNTFFDYLRAATGAGINGMSWTMTRLSGNGTVTSGSTAADSVPTTALNGSMSADETTMGYPGPVKVIVTDTGTGAVRVHSSKSIGIAGSWRTVDIPRGWRLFGTGVQPGINNELAVTTSGASMAVAVASGAAVVAIGDNALLYSWPAAQSLTATAADGSNPRIDTVVLRFYPPGAAQEGRVILALVDGTAASSPVAPTLTQSTSTYWEYPLADVRVNAGVSVIAADKVTDRRTYCLLYPSGITAGDTFYVDANGKFARLAKGTSGQYLKQGATIPAWDTITDADVPNIWLERAGDTSLGPLWVSMTAAEAFMVRKVSDGDAAFEVDTSAELVQIVNGADLVVWSDDYDTEVARIDGATGNISSDGSITANSASIATILTAADLTATDDLIVGDDASITDDLTVGGDATVTGLATVGTLTSGGAIHVGSSGGADTHRIAGHLKFENNVKPAISAGAGAGTSPSVASVISGSDAAHFIQLTVGTSPPSTRDAVVFTITLDESYDSSAWFVDLKPREADSGVAASYVYAISTGGDTYEVRLTGAGALTAGVNYSWQVFTCQGATV